MDNNPFVNYLKLLDQLSGELERLTGLARQKIASVQADDLMALDDVMRQEQAAALAFRGFEQKQTALLKATGLTGVPLSALAEHFPPPLRLEAKKTVENLQSQYQVYQKTAEVARNTLEINLHQIDRVLSSLGGSSAPSTGGPGYQPQDLDLPKPMKTDFRA